jgi:hypothetical protein
LKTLVYNCDTTSIYYMQYTFEKSTTFYAESVLAFHKDSNIITKSKQR